MCSLFQNKETGISIFEKLEKKTQGKFIIAIFPGKISSGNWGIKFDDKSPNIFNSRIETIESKPYWAKLFSTSRCLIPATGFYEWKSGINGKKIPQRISVCDDLFFIPSIFVKKNNLTMVSMITTEPNEFMRSIHHRMPSILKTEDVEKYLGSDVNIAKQFCIPFSENENMKIEVD